MNELQAFPKGNYKQQQKNRKVKRLRKKTGTYEEPLQIECEDVLDELSIAYIRIPDCLNDFLFGNDSFVPGYLKDIFAKYLKDLPDLIILFENGKYVCIELKSDIGIQKTGQKRFSKLLGEDNYYLCTDILDFKSIINKYINN